MTIPKGRSRENRLNNKASEAAGLKHDELKKVYDHTSIGILALDTDGIVVYINKIALNYLNLHSKEVINHSFFSLFRDALPDEVNEARLKRSEEVIDGEFTVKTPRGEKSLLISSMVHCDAEGLVQTYLFIRDISGIRKREKLFSYLNQAAAALAKTRGTSAALELISQFIVPKFANWFTIDLLKDNRLELLVLKHEDPEKIVWAKKYREKYPPDLAANSGPALVIKTGKPGFVPVVNEEMIDLVVTDPVQREEVKKIGLHSVIIVPIVTDGRITGLVNFISSDPDRYFDETDLDFAQNFSHLIGLSLDNARLNEEAAHELTLRKQSEEKFRFLTNAIPHKMWTSNSDGRATYYNQRWHDYTGIHGFEALREKIWDFIHPDDRDVAAIEWPQAVKNGEPMEMEHRLRRHDGVYRWHLSRFTPHKNEQGEIELWVGTSTDINEQKLGGIELAAANEELYAANEQLMVVYEEMTATNEELASANEELAATNEELEATNEELANIQVSLKRSEKLFRSIVLNIPKSLIIVIDKNRRFVTVEGNLMERMGYDRKNYEGKSASEIGPPERYEASRQLYDRVLAGERFSVDRKADNGDSYIVHFVPLKDDNGEVESGLIIALEVTDILQGEEKSAKLAAIVESSNDAIIGMTLESEITSWNDAATQMFGYTADEIIGQTIYKLIPPERYDEEAGIVAQLVKGERVANFETKRITKDGRLLDVSLTVSSLKDAKGDIIGQSKIARDITEKKQEEQRKIDFIGMVSHELKTPLTALSGLIQVANAKLRKSDDTFLATAMERANLQVKRMTGMINGFLNVSRLEAGKMSVQYEVFDLGELLREISEEIKLIVNTHTITLSGSARVMVNADRDKINSVVSNFLNNAVKYSPKGKRIEMAYKTEGEMVTVSIKDEGIGIKPKEAVKIFERYYRAETDYSQYISGFGIGLYLSSEIIKLHNGKIWVESENEKGSTFYFALPLADS